MKTYNATATREGKWWMIAIPELDGLTQSRRLSDADEMAREWIAVSTDTPIDEIAVEVQVDKVADIKVGDMVAEIKALRTEASDREALASALAVALAQRLADAEVPVRDIGAALHVSFQRASQLVNSGELSEEYWTLIRNVAAHRTESIVIERPDFDAPGIYLPILNGIGVHVTGRIGEPTHVKRRK